MGKSYEHNPISTASSAAQESNKQQSSQAKLIDSDPVMTQSSSAKVTSSHPLVEQSQPVRGKIFYNNESIPPSIIAYIALGSNVGNREQQLVEAIERIDRQPHIEVLRVSAVYQTDPVGYTDQPAFLNMVIAVRTTLQPLDLLRAQLDLERQLGRIRHERWGPRTIDLDLLLYDNVRMDQEELTLPHPRMMERAFVLVPLHDVIDNSHPLHDLVAEEHTAALQAGKDGITQWTIINWRNASEPSGN